MAASEARNIAEPLPRHLLSAVITCWNAKHAGITQAPALLDESPLLKPIRDSSLNDQKQHPFPLYQCQLIPTLA